RPPEGRPPVRERGLLAVAAEELVQLAGCSRCGCGDQRQRNRDARGRDAGPVRAPHASLLTTASDGHRRVGGARGNGQAPSWDVYGTIFEIGSSRMSVAPAAFSSGISLFTPRL